LLLDFRVPENVAQDLRHGGDLVTNGGPVRATEGSHRPQSVALAAPMGRRNQVPPGSAGVQEIAVCDWTMLAEVN